MDPDEALNRVRAMLRRYSETGDTADIPDVATLADALEALDAWLSAGGFLPAAWQEGRASR
jgi:hypothetical protein